MFRTIHTTRPLAPLAAVLALVAAEALPAALTAQVSAPRPPSGGASDPAALREFMDRAIVLPAQDDRPTVLTVTGEGRVEAPSDRAHISVAVITEGGSARDAAEANSAQMETLTLAVRTAGEGAQGFELRTRDFSVYPNYAPSDRTNREIVGYTVQNTLTVTVEDVLLVGDILDAALGAGANRVTGLQFDVADPEPYRRTALRAAVANAREEAGVIAEALGMQVGDPIEIQGGADTPLPFRSAVPMQALSVREAVPVEPGTQTVNANVTIRYRLDPGP